VEDAASTRLVVAASGYGDSVGVVVEESGS
jgi:hypothetical protein